MRNLPRGEPAGRHHQTTPNPLVIKNQYYLHWVVIVTSLALGVTGLLLFSSLKLFAPTREIIVYFDESLNS